MTYLVNAVWQVPAVAIAAALWARRRTMRFRAASHVRPLPDRLAEVVERSAAAFGRSGIPIFCSTETAGPLTIGLRHSVIILPEKFFGGVTDAEFSSAICHELAHIRRHDFGLNLVYELLSLPISFHPAATMIKRRIGQTRELVCDEMAAARVANRAVYARSLL